MLVSAPKVFDDIITGTATTWYSPQQLNLPLGAGDQFLIHAAVTGLSGSSPTLTVQLQHSGDNQNWVNLGGGAQISTALSNDSTYVGNQSLVVVLYYVRLAISLGGTNPQCRLKLYVAVHDSGHRDDGASHHHHAGLPASAHLMEHR